MWITHSYYGVSHKYMRGNGCQLKRTTLNKHYQTLVV